MTIDSRMLDLSDPKVASAVRAAIRFSLDEYER